MDHANSGAARTPRIRYLPVPPAFGPGSPLLGRNRQPATTPVERQQWFRVEDGDGEACLCRISRVSPYERLLALVAARAELLPRGPT
jgi:hypothetical protein